MRCDAVCFVQTACLSPALIENLHVVLSSMEADQTHSYLRSSISVKAAIGLQGIQLLLHPASNSSRLPACNLGRLLSRATVFQRARGASPGEERFEVGWICFPLIDLLNLALHFVFHNFNLLHEVKGISQPGPPFRLFYHGLISFA